MAKVKRLDHIGIAVKNLDDAIERFTRILGAEFIAKKESAFPTKKTPAESAGKSFLARKICAGWSFRSWNGKKREQRTLKNTSSG